MAKASAAEFAALDEAGPLIRFAAESVENLDPALPLAIATARAAHDADTWTPQVSQDFWAAFSKLCALIRPTTMDCIAAAHADYPRRRWVFFGPQDGNQSLAERSSLRYLPGLIILLVIVLGLQLYVWAMANASKRIDDTVAAAKVTAADMDTRYAKMIVALTAAASTSKKPETQTQSQAQSQAQIPPQIQPQTPEDMAQNAAISHDFSDLGTAVSAIFNDLALLEALSGALPAPAPTAATEGAKPNGDLWPPPPGPTADIATWYTYMSQTYQLTLRYVGQIQPRATLMIGIVGSFVLPVFMGALGACAFVLRSISEAIRATTFSTTSPIRNVMRVVLGALLGGVVGLFTNLSSQIALPLLALAFLAGYGVEGVFSMFDGFIERFRAASK